MDRASLSRLIGANIRKYRIQKDVSQEHLALESSIHPAYISKLERGEKCPTIDTLYRLAKVLGVSIEDILESARTEYRSSFETFKSNTCHHVKDMGDVDFMIQVLESDEIRTLYERKWYPEALYLLAMLDYLSRENNIPVCTRYDDIRARRLSKPIYPAGVLMTCEVLKSEAPLRKAEKEAIPEFRRFNIIENEVRNVV